ncbi:O-antigen ligase family protein [Arenibacter amylolyticus]|uniref:O-antigen ligase family protein n=1 Tax=Arenibacter amylolyticus TaxID=1406873 RepID=UPI000A3C968F|nr:O-antigen ligase family protein [Arenibacter amylolyticus]
MKLKIQTIFNVFLFFLPFTQALTINVFFPLKISELLLLILIVLFIQLKWETNYFKILRETQVLLIFLAIATLSFMVNAFWTYDYPPKAIPSRIGRIPDSFLRLVYIYLNVIAFIISIFFIGKNKKQSLNFWLKGALLAAIYGWYLFISSALNLPYLTLFGMDENPQTLFGIVRSGTFKEGNYFGLFLLLSSTIAFYLNKTRTGIFLIISIVTTFSTISIVSAILFLAFYFKSLIFRKRVLKIFLLLLPFILISTFAFSKSEFYQKYVHAKLFTPLSTLTKSNMSKVDRYLTGDIAFHAGLNNPIWGVGPYNYGLHYDQYNNIYSTVKNHSDWSRQYFKRTNLRAIPNNVYLEVWAEYGIIGFLFFIMFLAMTLWTALKIKNNILTGGLLAMYLSLNAFPSFIMLFLWVYLAIPYAIFYHNSNKQS